MLFLFVSLRLTKLNVFVEAVVAVRGVDHTVRVGAHDIGDTIAEAVANIR